MVSILDLYKDIFPGILNLYLLKDVEDTEKPYAGGNSIDVEGTVVEDDSSLLIEGECEEDS